MSYEPTTWQTGDTITATKMNKLEQGVANSGGGLLITVTDDEGTLTLDKTYAEIVAAINNGVAPIIVTTEPTGALGIDYVCNVYIETDTYYIETMDGSTYLSDSEGGVLTWYNPNEGGVD